MQSGPYIPYFNVLISECKDGLDRYRGKRGDVGRAKREVTGDDYIYNGEKVLNDDWPWAASLEITKKYRKNDRHTVKGQYLQGVSEKMSHSWEPKKLGTSYSETNHLLDLKLRQQGALMSTPCSQSLRPNRCVVSEYEVPNFLCSQEWDIFSWEPAQ